MRQINKLISNNINEKSGKFALIIGSSPSKGARSPSLWNKAYKHFKIKSKMFPADINKKNLEKLCNHLKKNKNFLGSSVTIPHKEIIINYLDKIDINAKNIGSVNTFVKIKNKLVGYNTDYYGSLFSLKKCKLKKSKNKILVLGCGGAGKACIASVINYFNNSEIIFFNRNQKKLEFFLKNFKNKNKNKLKQINKYIQIKKYKNINLILNTTSIGFDTWFKDNNKKFFLKNYCPLSKVQFVSIKNKNEEIFVEKNRSNIIKNVTESFNILRNLKNVMIFDIIYSPKETILIKLSKLFGFKIMNGLNMNLIQAVEGFKIVNSSNLSKEKILKAMTNG